MSPSSTKPDKPSPSPEPITITEIPLSLPPRDTSMPPGHRTLLSLIDSQRPRDANGNPIVPRRRNQSGAEKPSNQEEPSTEDGQEGEEMEDLIGPLATSIFWAIPLTFLHFAFDVVVYQQYSQDIIYSEICIRCLKAFPILLLLISLLHPHRPHPLIQTLFFLLSTTSGCWLIHAANNHAYYNVMKRAPPVGVLWIWAAAEMELGTLVGSCLLVGGWVWWGGYEIV